MSFNVAVVGCGLIGQKRAKAISDKAKVVVCFDIDSDKSKAFAKMFNCTPANSLNQIIDSKEIDIVLIATQHNKLAEIARLSIISEKHTFLEKPGALNTRQLELVESELKNNKNKRLHIGYNHRYHPAIIKALEISRSKGIGELMFLRARYGHGGRLGYEKEWRSIKEISGGGELIDQGSHLLDLAIAFLGEIKIDYARTPTYFWKSEVEDNAFISVINPQGKIGFLHASSTEWKNTFSLEIYYKYAKIEISGLGGSYGAEKLTLYRMSPEMGIPSSEIWEYPLQDESWKLEFDEFLEDIEFDKNKTDNLADSKKVLQLIEEIYEKTNR